MLFWVLKGLSHGGKKKKQPSQIQWSSVESDLLRLL